MSEVERALEELVEAAEDNKVAGNQIKKSIAAAQAGEINGDESAMDWSTRAIRRSNRTIEHLTSAQGFLQMPSPDLIHPFSLALDPEEPWTPSDDEPTKYFTIHLPPGSLIVRTWVELVLSGAPTDIDRQNLLAWWVDKKNKNNIGVNTKTLLYAFWKRNTNCTFRNGWNLEGNQHTKDVNKFATWPSSGRFVVRHQIDYEPRLTALAWNSAMKEGSAAKGDQPVSGDHGLLFALSGKPARPEEVPIKGVNFHVVAGEVHYRAAA